MAENIVIPKQFYVNYSMRDNHAWNNQTHKWDKEPDAKLGFATYYEDNAACRKRQSTINAWAAKDNGKCVGEILDNGPRTGFKFSKCVTHGGGWNDTSTYWRVQDPTGFELEITASNVARLMKYVTIKNGEILEECLWGWDKNNQSKVTLLPRNCELYEQALVTSDRHFAPVVSLKEVKIGDRVELKNGETGVYFGKVTVGVQMYNEYSDETQEGWYGKITTKETYVFVQVGDDNKILGGTQLFFMSSPKVVGIQRNNEQWPLDVAERHLNTLLHDKKTRRSAFSIDSEDIKFITYDKKVELKYEMRMAPHQEVIDYIRDPRVVKEVVESNLHSEMTVANFRNRGRHDNPIVYIAAMKNLDLKIVNGMPNTKIVSQFDRDTRETTYAPNPQRDFIKGESDVCILEGSAIKGPLTVETGAKYLPNPQWKPRDQRHWNYDYYTPMYQTDKFVLSEVSSFYEPILIFKDYRIKVGVV